MATRIKAYINTLTGSVTDIEEWFSQFAYHLFEEGLIHPAVPETDASAEQITAYNTMDKRIAAHFMMSISLEHFVLLKNLMSPK